MRARRAPTLRRGELLSAGCAVALLIVLFGLQWYGVAGVPDPTRAQPAISGVENGWQALSLVRWVIVVTALVAVGSLGLHLTERAHGTRTETGALVLGLGLLCALLLLWRVAIQLPSPAKVTDQKLGAVIGLLCAFGIAFGGHESLVELRDRRRAATRVGGPRPAAEPDRPADPAPTEARPAPVVEPRSLPVPEPDPAATIALTRPRSEPPELELEPWPERTP